MIKIFCCDSESFCLQSLLMMSELHTCASEKYVSTEIPLLVMKDFHHQLALRQRNG